ncbi:hypothetical protein DITRI_Ditri14bG0145400 [Diplodiscus trichospermus]
MLNLHMNKFSGIIPPIFAKGCALRNLNLNGNQLEGPLTQSIINCVDSEVLDLGSNKINDTFPHWLASLPKLQVLILQSNQLHGPIYDTKSNSFSKIRIFDLSSNYFTGPLPMSYSIRTAVEGQEIELVKIFTMLIDFSSNRFEGEIPDVIGKLNSLKRLNLSHKKLSGFIPASIGNLTSLELLDLSSNHQGGAIPESLLNMTSLSVFHFSKNQLSGQIPEAKQFNDSEMMHMEETREYVDFQSPKVAATMSHRHHNCHP